MQCGDRRLAVRPNGHAGHAGPTILTWRPEHGSVRTGCADPAALPGRLVGASFLGPVVRLRLALASGETVLGERPARDWFAAPLEPGAEL